MNTIPTRRTRSPETSPAAGRVFVALAAVLAAVLVAVMTVLASPSSASTVAGAHNAVGVIHLTAGQRVGPHDEKLPGQRRARAPGYDQTTVGSGVAPEEEFTPPETYLNRHGQLTNGTYTLDEAGMAPHQTGSFADGKSQFFSWVDSDTATLDAGAYADENGLWIGNKATVPVTNGEIGALGSTGEPTSYINVYRTNTGFVHGSPGGGP